MFFEPPGKFWGIVTEDEVLAFIRTCFPSVWALELFLALRRKPGRKASFDDLVKELRSSTVAVREAITGLQKAGIVVEENDSCSYMPASPTIDSIVAEIEKLYAVKPASVIKAIVTAPNERLHLFANSFKLKD